MLRRLGRELLWAAIVVFVFIPCMIAGMNNANERMMRQISRINTRQLVQPASAAPAAPDETRPLILLPR